LSYPNTEPHFPAIAFSAPVSISPSTGIAAWNYKGGPGAWRLWILARALDTDAKNYCEITALRQALEGMGVSERCYFYWLKAAEGWGLLRLAHGNAYYMAEHKAALVFRAHPDAKKATIDLGSLFKKGWKNEVWAAYIRANHNGEQISRKKLHDITGVGTTRQRGVDRLVKRQQNIAITEHGGEHLAQQLQAYREFTNKAGPFIFKDKGKGDKVAYHLPARVSVPDKIATVGTTPKFHYTARQYSRTHSFSPRRANGEREIWRLFYDCEPHRLLQGSARLSDPDEVFVRRGHSSRVQTWDSRLLQKPNTINPVFLGVRIVGQL
jgi:hypothetical protein